MIVSCSLPQSDKKCLVTISLPGAAGGARTIKMDEYLIHRMRYELEFTGTGKIQNFSAAAGDTFTVYLEPGRWHIEVNAFYPEEAAAPEWWDWEKMGYYYELRPAGKGSEDKVIAPGSINHVEISLTVFEDFVKPVFQYGDKRFWSSDGYIDLPDFWSHIEFNHDLTEYRWFASMEKNEWIALNDGEPSEEANLELQANNKNDIWYYYCEITCYYESTAGEDEPVVIKTDIFTVYPATSGGLQARIDDAEDGEEIFLPPNNFAGFLYPAIYMTQTIVINKNITLLGAWDGTTLRRKAVYGEEFFDHMFVVNNGCTLTLKGGEYSALELNGDIYNFYGEKPFGSLVKVAEGGSLVMGEMPYGNNVTLTSNRAENGGAVNLESGGTFIMNGGLIKDNFADNGGGVYMSGGIFTMNGGVIGGNPYATAPDTEINSAVYGGGVYVGSGSFTMAGGEIKGNKARAAPFGVGSEEGNGGGVCVSSGGTFCMQGGIISGNETEKSGGGVYIAGSETVFSKTGGIIYGSEAGTSAELQNNAGVNGSAVFYDDSSSPRYRDNTAGEGVDMSLDLVEEWNG